NCDYGGPTPTMPITTVITIAAPPSVVRETILDFAAYPQWNPFITFVQVSDPAAAPGTNIKVTISKFINQNATIERNDPGEFSWLSIIIAKWFFMADHRIRFEAAGEAGEMMSCKVVQSEALSGFLSLL